MDNFYETIDAPKTVMEEVKQYAAQLLEAKRQVADAELKLKEATSAYNKLAKEVLPSYYKANGINKLLLDDGTKLSVERVVTCSPLKAAKPDLIKWLKKNNGSDIISESLTVQKEFSTQLKDLGIAYVENGDVNTATLKAWLKRKLGLNGGEASIDWKDIPDYVNLYQYDEVKITKKEI